MNLSHSIEKKKAHLHAIHPGLCHHHDEILVGNQIGEICKQGKNAINQVISSIMTNLFASDNIRDPWGIIE